ncbi:MAG: hypothetical protein IMX01_09145 [Limnochordaceae bacterium]|nr:hypothetical protein [Limnochordaceae bacterium]
MTRSRYSEIKTEFVKRELQRTSWENRSYIDMLMLIEDIYAQGGPKHLSEGMWLFHITEKYPVAVHAIKSELVEGKILSDQELLAWRAEKKREEERRRKEWEEEQKRRKQEEIELERLAHEEWIGMGGLL